MVASLLTSILIYLSMPGRTVPANDCYIQFISSNTTVTFITALLAFYVPTLVMIFLNWRVYLANERHLEYKRAFQSIGKVIPAKAKENCQRTIIAYAQKKDGDDSCKGIIYILFLLPFLRKFTRIVIKSMILNRGWQSTVVTKSQVNFTFKVLTRVNSIHFQFITYSSRRVNRRVRARVLGTESKWLYPPFRFKSC